MLRRKTHSHLETELRRQLSAKDAELGALYAERDALCAQLEGDIPAATFWLQTKVWRQRRALDRLEHRNSTLRFALRIMNTIREPVTAEEWVKARDTANDRLLARIAEDAPVS